MPLLLFVSVALLELVAAPLVSFMGAGFSPRCSACPWTGAG